jgi:hypothetical protein
VSCAAGSAKARRGREIHDRKMRTHATAAGVPGTLRRDLSRTSKMEPERVRERLLHITLYAAGRLFNGRPD